MAMGRALLAFLFAGTACAQTIVPEQRLAPGLRNFETRPAEPVLRCEVNPIKPTLNFSFRFQAGYVVRVPMDQYEGPNHGWAILAKVTPEGEGAKPVYLL